MADELYIVNWEKYQHYKDRNPPWIKLHWTLLQSLDWVVLDDASRVLAIACMLVASRNDGKIRCDHIGIKYLERVAHLNQPPNLQPLIDCGFIADACAMLADASAMHQNAIPETETETETEKEADQDLLITRYDFGAFWSAYPRKIGKRKAQEKWNTLIRQREIPDIATILDAVETQKQSRQWQQEGGKYIPHPTTWLNRAGWEDDLEPVTQTNKELEHDQINF